MFGSTGSGATRQQEDASPGNAKYGLHGISPPPPAKMIKQDPSQAQASSSTVSATWGAPPHTTARPAPTPSTAWGPPPTSSTGGPTPSTAWGSPQPGARSYQVAQSYGQSHNPHQGRPVYEAPIMSNQKPPAHSNSTESHNNYQFQAQATPLVTSQAVSDSSAQSLALSEKTDDDLKKDEVEEMSADVLLKEMIEMQKQQLYELVPQMKRSEEMSDQILTSVSLVLRDVTNYGEKLAVTKQLYCSRLSQVSSYLSMIPKTEK